LHKGISKIKTPAQAAEYVLKGEDKALAFRCFLSFVKTIDEHRPGAVHPFPVHMGYLMDLADYLVTEQIVFVEKTRQMLLTHLCTARCVFEAIRGIGSLIAIQSKGVKEANYIIEKRVKTILACLPENVFFDSFDSRELPPRARVHRDGLTSEIMGIPQGEEKARSYTFSGFFSDECAFQPEFDEALAATMPALISGQNQGWFMAVSTPNGKDAFFRAMYEFTETAA